MTPCNGKIVNGFCDKCFQPSRSSSSYCPNMISVKKSFIDDEKKYTKRDLDFAYLMAVCNVSGMEGLQKEIDRLKKLGVEPSDIVDLAKNKSHD